MDPLKTAPPSESRPSDGDPRHLFLELSRSIPDLTLRAKALAAWHSGQSITTLLGGEAVASLRYPLEGFSPWRDQLPPVVRTTGAPRLTPTPMSVRWRAQMSEDGLVNRTR